MQAKVDPWTLSSSRAALVNRIQNVLEGEDIPMWVIGKNGGSRRMTREEARAQLIKDLRYQREEHWGMRSGRRATTFLDRIIERLEKNLPVSFDDPETLEILRDRNLL